MTKNDLIELEAIARDIMLNAIDYRDFEQFAHGLKLWMDAHNQLTRKGATVC